MAYAGERPTLYNSYADASVALNTALTIALESLAEVYPVSTDEQDELLISARQLLDNLFHGAAKRLDDEGIDGSAVLAKAASKYPFDDEASADMRFNAKLKRLNAKIACPNPTLESNIKRAALTAPLFSGNGEGL